MLDGSNAILGQQLTRLYFWRRSADDPRRACGFGWCIPDMPGHRSVQGWRYRSGEIPDGQTRLETICWQEKCRRTERPALRILSTKVVPAGR